MQIEFAALSFDLANAAGTEIQLTPTGLFRARDGRPKDLPGWKIDGSIAARVVALAAQRKTPFVIDYEHQTLNSEKNGQPAPAAGWFKNLEWREGLGLFATDVEWTPRAKAWIESGEYKFISPVLSFNRATGEVLQLQMAALVNAPAVDGMDAVAALAHEFFSRSQEPTPHRKDQNMKAIALLLGLAEDASEADITAAVTALKASAAEDKTTIAALKTQSPDPARFVPVETVTQLQTELAALTTRLNDDELDDVVTTALKAGKLLPAMEGWARDLGRKDIAALRAYVEKIPAALNGNQTGGRQPDGSSAGDLNADQLAVCKLMGVSAEDFKATTQAAA